MSQKGKPRLSATKSPRQLPWPIREQDLPPYITVEQAHRMRARRDVAFQAFMARLLASVR